MKKVMLSIISLIALTSSTFAYYEENSEVQAMANTGSPTLTKNATDCTFGNHVYSDLLGNKKSYNDGLCVKHVKLPNNVLREIIEMEDNQLENESDYDQRLTKFYVFKQDRYTPNGNINDNIVKRISNHFNIPQHQIEDIRYRSFVGKKNSLAEFEGLAIGDWEEETHTLKYLRSIIKDKLVMHISFGNELDLYPGGGFLVEYNILIIDGALIFIKRAGWNS